MSPRATAVALFVLGLGLPGAPAAQQRIVDIRQGTSFSAALSPEGSTLVIDLLGQLWRLPATGGGATPITPPGERARQPRVSPDGRLVVYQRRLPHGTDIWLLDLTTGTRRALTDDTPVDREPDFTPDGRAVVFSSDRAGDFDLWTIDLARRELLQLTAEDGDVYFPTVSEHGDIAYVHRTSSGSSLRNLSRDFGNLELYRTDDVLSAPSWRPEGGVIVFNERQGTDATRLRMLLLSDERVIKDLATGEDVFDSRAAWISPAQYIYVSDGQMWRRGIGAVRREPVHLFASIGVDAPARPMTGLREPPGPHPATVAGAAQSASGNRIVFGALGDLWLAEGGRLERLTDDRHVETHAAFVSDDRRIVYASDRGGGFDLWMLDVESGESRRLTASAEKSYRPSADARGTRIAYLETDGFGPWARARLRVLDVETGTVRTLREDLLGAERPAWIAGDGAETLEVVAGEDLGAGPRHRAWIFDAALAPTRSEAREAPQRADPPAVPNPPEWTPARGTDRYAVQVGRLFDGIRGTYRRHVDVHVREGRIEAVVGRGVRELPATVVDAREETMLPGFVDVHVHQSALAGERLGRLWLAHGVTTVREVTDDLDEALSRGEAWAAGRRVGPRLVVTPREAGGPGRRPAEMPILPGEAVLNGPLHRGHDLVGLRQPGGGAADARRIVAALARDALPLEFRTSALEIQYQDVYATIIENGYVSMSSLAAAGGFELAWPPRARPFLGPLFGAFYAADEQLHWQNLSRGEAPRGLTDSVIRLVRAGARVAIGSDAPAVPYGLGFHAELARLADAGIANDQILRMATAEGALALGLDHEIGTLQAGRLADYLIVDGDPLARIEDAARIVTVARGGRVFSRAELLDPGSVSKAE